MNRLQLKINSYYTNTMKALWYYYKIEDIETALHRFRCSGEAFMKAVIYRNYGEIDGHDIILGKKDAGRQFIQHIGYNLSFSELHDILVKAKCLDEDYMEKLSEINVAANKFGGSHDLNATVDFERVKKQMDKVVLFSEELSRKLYDLCQIDYPVEMSRGYKEHIINDDLMNSIQKDDIEDLISYLDNFNPQNHYILISPRSFKDVKREQIRMLKSIPWSFVIDFNPLSKESGGLYEAFMPEVESHCVPLTIQDKDKPDVGNGTSGSINWVFANGLKSMKSTLVSDVREWIQKKYHKFIKKLFQIFCRHSLKRICVVCLYDDYDYVDEIVRALEDIDELERDLLSFVFISSNNQFLNKVENFEKYGFACKAVHLDLTEFLAVVDSEDSNMNETVTVLVPARKNADDKVEDISDISSKLMDNGIFPVHINLNLKNSDQTDIPGFYKGETISWNELAIDVDVHREVYYDIRKQVEAKLDTARSSKRFDLLHRPGAGGTTISRRLAFDMRKKYPVVILTSYKPDATFKNLDVISRRVARPMLAIVESSISGNIDDLINECNVNKRVIVFVVVSRETKKKRQNINKGFSAFLSEMMASPEEKSRFMEKVKLYRNNKANSLDKIPYRESEVIEYALTIGDNDFSSNQIETYVKSYINGLSEPLSEFLTYVSLVYHYSQKPVSENVFRKLFKYGDTVLGLSLYLAHNKEERDMLQKLIVRTSSEGDSTTLWRPRFSRFADVAIQQLLSGSRPELWKDYLPEVCLKLINRVKENNEYLCEDVEKMLTAVFLNRGVEDPLGVEEKWESNVVNDKFSLLIEDIAVIPHAQKRVLLALTDAYPDKSHFWGHLARFCYEKADIPTDFEEASRFVQNALGGNGEYDPVILHVAGMCKRRIIEYYKRHEIPLQISKLKELTEESKGYFEMSRKQKAQNVHSYISEIQLLIIVIEFGKSMTKFENYLSFLVSDDNKWFLEQFEILEQLIKETEILLDHMSTIAINQRLTKSIRYLTQGESSSHEFLGDYQSSLKTLRNKIDEVDRNERPRLRLIYINTLLRSKVNGNNKRIREAWELLNENELNLVEHFLDLNIRSGGNNTFSLRTWFDFVRFTHNDISEDDVKSRLRLLYRNSENAPMVQLESAYYYYVVSAVQLIRDNDVFDKTKIEETEEWMTYCNKLSPNNKFCYEWLASLDGLSGVVNYRNKVDNVQLIRLNGTISRIRNQQQGLIELDCGLKAFFVPSYGNFLDGHDETTRVSCCIGFRHEGLFAADVERLNEESQNSGGLNEEIVDSVEIVEELGEDANIGQQILEESKKESSVPLYKLESETKRNEFKVIKKIQLDEKDLKRKRW